MVTMNETKEIKKTKKYTNTQINTTSVIEGFDECIFLALPVMSTDRRFIDVI